MLKFSRHSVSQKFFKSIQCRNLTGLVVTGSYEEDEFKLSLCGRHLNEETSAKLSNLIKISTIKKARTFYGVSSEYPVIAVANIESSKAMKSYELASRDPNAEAVRSAIGHAVTSLKADPSVTEIAIDSSGDAKAAAEASVLSLFKFEQLKSKKTDSPSVTQCKIFDLPQSCEMGWQEGLALGKYQNFARYLMEMPANHMTPDLFVKAVQERIAEDFPNGEVSAVVRDRAWIEEQKMGAFLSVAKGSEQPPFLLELHYKGAKEAEEAPVCMVGKGVTFDTGGISIKPSKGMDAMRADMGGAACVTAATLGAAALSLPLNLVSLLVLCENMPSGGATKPGDVVTAMDGTTIQVDNTDAEGRLILADALTYSDTFQPRHLIDAATLTGAMAVALGGGCAGAYCTGEELWGALETAGKTSGDRLWRMPLFAEYGDLLKSPTADVNNISSEPYGGSITAAKFLERFVKCESWAHLDIAGVMSATNAASYLPKGMSGRPTRTLMEALRILSR